MVLRFLIRFLLSLSIGLVSIAEGQTSMAPFELSWTGGTCRPCQIVRELGEVGFTGPQTIWGVGYYFPTEGQGSGDYSVVRSSDSGRHWVEVSKSRMHATEPSFSFVNSTTGWISGMSLDGSGWVLRTRDAGSHWTAISDHFIQNMHFINASVAVGAEFDGRVDLFAKSTDGGRTWTTSNVPGVKFINKVLFITPELGWIAGTNDLSDDLNGRVAVVLRTANGGRQWTSFQIPSQVGVADVRDLFFLNESVGWMVAWHYNNNGTHLYRTTDGGKTWTIHPDETIQGTGKWLSVVRFLNPKIGFAFSRDDKVEPMDEPGVDVVANPQAGPTNSGRLLYSDDGGEHWQSNLLDAWVYDCQVLGEDLGCSASKNKPGFLMLLIKPRATTKSQLGPPSR